MRSTDFTPHVITVNSGEGRFDILSLSGPFVPNENLEAKKWSRGMSISLAGPNGRVLGGGLAGMLAAAGPVQVRNYDFAPKMEMTLNYWVKEVKSLFVGWNGIS
ncbi:hypothetical protein L2E82_44491 [Cichorium intybus]|uniref:Uncharacterized protein n=1 Tax=Cichorium intybus TaxID=13427 RepID=A0ACB8ZPI2_CICIN|nr:hypothetical protein L2E82_44491 [Cichorium intybus]